VLSYDWNNPQVNVAQAAGLRFRVMKTNAEPVSQKNLP
jgi:hypothetical protein